MSALISIGIKNSEGKWVNYTISINDETDQYGNNVSMYVEQSKEERDAKVKRNYIGNGKVFWTDGGIAIAKPKQEQSFFQPPTEQNKQQQQQPPKLETAQPAYFGESTDPDDLPF